MPAVNSFVDDLAAMKTAFGASEINPRDGLKMEPILSA